MKAPTRVNKHK